MTSPTARRIGLALVAIGVLVLSGCFRMDMSVTIYADDTADVQTDVLFYDAADPSDVEDMCQDQGIIPGQSADIEPIEEDGMHGCRYAMSGVDIDTLESEQGLAVYRDGDQMVFAVDGLDDDFSDLPAGSDPEIRISATFPGPIIEASGGQQDGQTLTWTLDSIPADGIEARSEIDSTSTAGDSGGGNGSSSTVLWIVAGVVLLLLLVGGLIFFLVRRSKSRAQTGAPHGGQGLPPGGQYPQQGGQYPGPGGQYPQQGGQYPGPGGQYPQQGGQYGQPGPQQPGYHPQHQPGPFDQGQHAPPGGHYSQPGQHPSQYGQAGGQSGQPPHYAQPGGHYSQPGQVPQYGQGQQPAPPGDHYSQPGQHPGQYDQAAAPSQYSQPSQYGPSAPQAPAAPPGHHGPPGEAVAAGQGGQPHAANEADEMTRLRMPGEASLPPDPATPAAATDAAPAEPGATSAGATQAPEIPAAPPEPDQSRAHPAAAPHPSPDPSAHWGPPEPAAPAAPETTETESPPGPSNDEAANQKSQQPGDRTDGPPDDQGSPPVPGQG